jgi:hypothetical protein
VIGEFSFQKKLGFLEKGGDVDGMIEAIEGLLLYASTIGQVPEANSFLLGNPTLPYLLPVGSAYSSLVAIAYRLLANGTVE